MIRHVVMWRVRGAAAAERAAARTWVRQAFEGLRGRIPGLLSLEVGLDHSAVDHACDLVLVADFDTPDALAAHAVHPEHLRVRTELGDVRCERHQVDHFVDR